MMMSTTSTLTIRAPAQREGREWRWESGSIFSASCILLGVALFGAPLAFGAVKEWAWASLSLLALILLVLWAIGNAKQGVLQVAWSPLYIPAAMFLFLAGIQFFAHLSPDPKELRESLLKLITDFIIFFIAGQLWAANAQKLLRGLGFATLVFALLLSLLAVVEYFSSPGLIYWRVKPVWDGNIFGPYVNRNHYAGLMEMLIPLSVGYVFSLAERHPRRIFLGFSILLPVASVFLSGSRGGFMALLAELIILAVVARRRLSIPARRNLALSLATGMVAATLLFLWMDTGHVAKRLATLFQVMSAPKSLLGDRARVPLDTLRIFRDHSLAGAGLGSFRTVYPRYQSFPSGFWWEHAHNDYIEALAETGLAGGLLILAALVGFFYLAFANWGERIQNQIGWIQLGAALGCCGLLVHSLSDFNLHIPANALWFSVCAAWSTMEPRSRNLAPARTRDSRWHPTTAGSTVAE